MPSVAVVIVAAGSGTRLGAREPKAFVRVAGQSLLERAVEGAWSIREPIELVVVAPAAHLDAARATVGRRGTVVSGGATRQQSVRAGLGSLSGEVSIVLVHDAARALTPTHVFESVIAHVRETGRGAVPALPVVDTLKRVDPDERVAESVDRDPLRAAQTPQGFARAVLEAAYASAVDEHTDDAALVGAAGHPVDVVPGDESAFKITTPGDLARAERALGASPLRSGIGVDVHAYDESRPLWLGGLHWPDEPGLAGHSDGDVLSHALCDALLSAAGLGDLGSRFGTSDPALEGARGDVFLERTRALVTGAGWSIVNVAVQVIGRRPRVGVRRAELEAHLERVLGAPVSVSATTSDGLGFTGRGEGLMAIATALVSERR